MTGIQPAQQLVARIKRGCKYWGQTAPNQWFDVRVVEDTHYQLRGNSNNYRVSDVVLGMRLSNGSILDFTNGKVTAAPKDWAARGDRGGPTETDPNRPYCKPDQSCCDFVCGN